MKHVVTYRIDTVKRDQVIRIDDVSSGLTHLLAALKEPGMSEYLLGKGLFKGHKEYGPVDRMETDDVLSYKMKICGP